MKVIKIGAVWCSGCLVMKPRWAEIEKLHPTLYTEYFDFDADYDQIKSLNIEGNRLPTFIFTKNNGEEITRLSGEVDKKTILELIDKYKYD